MGHNISDSAAPTVFYNQFTGSQPPPLTAPIRWSWPISGYWGDMMSYTSSGICFATRADEDLNTYKFLNVTGLQPDFQYYAVTRAADSPDSLGKRLLQYLLEPRQQALVESMGYSPVK